MKKISWKKSKPIYESFFQKYGKTIGKDVIPRDNKLKDHEFKKEWSETIIILRNDGLERVYERGSNDSFFIDMGFMDMRIDLKENTKFIFKNQLKHLQQYLTNTQKNN